MFIKAKVVFKDSFALVTCSIPQSTKRKKMFRQTVPQRWPGGGKRAVTELVAWSLDQARSIVRRPQRMAASGGNQRTLQLGTQERCQPTNNRQGWISWNPLVRGLAASTADVGLAWCATLPENRTLNYASVGGMLRKRNDQFLRNRCSQQRKRDNPVLYALRQSKFR